MKNVQNLFCYGTLQLEEIQLLVFDRVLIGISDKLVGFKKSSIQFQESGEKVEYPLAIYTGKPSDYVNGTMFKVSLEDLFKADFYETKAYTRESVQLFSGYHAWVYLAA